MLLLQQLIGLLLINLAYSETPDSVSISTVNHIGPMKEGNQYELQCDVLNVAPVQNLTVKWYKGQTLVDQITFSDTIKTPVNETATLMIRPDRSDDGVQYRCEAELELGEEGPQPPPNFTSDPLNLTVFYEPIINETKLPSRVSVFRGYPVEIVCKAKGNPKPTISWNLGTNNTVYNETLTITDSTPEELSCIANNSVGTDIRHVKVSIQETPDSVSISTVNHIGPMMEENQYELQCDVLNVAPVQYLTVKWYKGQTLVDQTTFNNTIKTPVNETATIMIHPDRSDDGVQYRCEAELDLGAEGPQPPPKVTSDPLNITVFYEPIISETKLPSRVSVFRGYPVEIVCKAEGNPEPTISWNLGTNNTVYNETLTITDSTPEELSCIANNSVGTDIRHVKVSIQDGDCPIELNPQRAVVRYGGSVAADCKTYVQHDGMGWEASEGAVPMSKDNLITWRVSNLREWDIEPFCYINHKEQCQKELPVTVYKTPDSVSISTVNHTGPMKERNQYELQCDVLNVAPVQNLTVKWYKGQTLVDQTTFSGTIKTPVDKTVTLMIRPDRSDDGVQYRCEAELKLGEEGSQPPPKVTSDPLNITVHYEPIINETKLPSIVPVFRGYPVEIVCEAEGNPKPTISWNLGTNNTVYSETLTITDSTPEELSCIADNSVGTDIRHVKVSIQDKPIINKIKLPSRVSVFRGYPVEIVCEAEGNPKPTISWNLGTNNTVYSETLTITDSTPEELSCIADNSVGTDIRHVKVSIKDGDCPVELNPQRVVVEYGGPVSVNCSTSIPHDGMGWEASEGGVPMSKDNLITWRVSNLREWDIEPFCYINPKVGDQCLSYLPVTVYKTPDSVSISTVNHTGPMKERNQYELQCDVLNVAPVQNLTVKWFKGQTLVNQTTFTDTIKTPVDKTVTLMIRPDRSDDGVQYRCEAELDLGEEGPQPPPKVTSDPLNITVHYKPQINLCEDWSPKNETPLVSYPNLNSIKGNPRPNISWRRKSSPLSAFVPLNTNDSGKYELTASNELGNFTCTINILVEYPPQLNCGERYEVKEKTDWQPPCFAGGLPKPYIFLYKNGKNIQLPFYPKWNDSGLYQLNASNKHGAVNSYFTLNILYAPMIHASQDKFSVEEDSNITLECNSTGNPEPDVWWSFNNKNISTRRRHILNIEKATSTSAGVYTCSAKNNVGHKDKNFVVEIRGKPPNYILYVVAALLVLLVIIALCLYLWKKNKSSGSYDIQPEHEMHLLSNGVKS
ncbi:intercellular adhesion molecule 5 isoform X2 [Megalobrama amblycephala]|uniref:intercellular adhesion molecule 5 isoform X2 n=1 Tax=Megalobrama amblycephala TaxID=75352 RepID=UPI002013DB04|nr:intercellular adhesion molecule 5 isoform X2 [Megalobrama amblycephala]